jgi:hypothetical protein
MTTPTPCWPIRWSWQSLLAAAAAAIGLGAAAETATAAPGWRPPLSVETSPSATALSFPKVVARPDGCTTVAFERGGVVFASTRPAAGAFAPLQALASIASGEYPDLAAGAAGVAAAVWEDTGSKVRIATATGCEPLGAPAQVPGSYAFTEDPVAAVDAAGTAIAVFQAGGSGSRKIHHSERPPGGAPSEPTPFAIPAGTESFRPQVAANDAGGAAVVFDVVNAGSQVYGARRLGATGWSTPVQLNQSGNPAVAGSARVAMAGDGSLHAVWIDSSTSKLAFATLAPGGALTRTTLHEVAGGSIATDPPAPAIAVDGEGRVAVAWTQVVAIARTVKAKVREPGSGSFSGVLNVSPTTSEGRGNPLLAIDRDGRVVATWSAYPTVSTQRTAAATRLPGAAGFDEEKTVSDLSQVAGPSDLGTDADGNTVVAMLVSGPLPREAKVAAFDAAGPLLGPLAASSGVAGDAQPFSIAALDAWSPTLAAQWEFGDGDAASGDSVSHAYASAGTFSVKATVADALGNASEASGSVTVGARPAAAPGGGERGPVIPTGGKSEPPKLSLRLTPKRFKAGPGPKTGARLIFSLSESARVRFVVKPLGAEVGKRSRPFAVAQKLVRRGSFKRDGREGRNHFRFSGRIGGRALRPGAYKLRAVATDPDGLRSQPRSVPFTILAD